MAVDIPKLLDDINDGLLALAQEGYEFPAAEELPPMWKPRQATYATTNLQPPSEVYITRELRLRVRLWNSVANNRATVVGRVLKLDGETYIISESFTPTSDRVVNAFFITVPEGFLLNVSIFAAGTVVQRGQMYATIDIAHPSGLTFAPNSLLLADYLQNGVMRSWPFSPQVHPLTGRGAILKVESVTLNPTADYIFSVPTGARWKLWHVSCTVETDATVGNRFPVLKVNTTTSPDMYAYSISAIAASVIAQVDFAHFGNQATAVSGFRQVNLPLWPSWPAGTDFQITLSGAAAGDLVSEVTVFAEEWIAN